MKFFIILIFLVAAASWAFFSYIVWAVPPEIDATFVLTNLTYFFISGTIAVGLTASLIFYFVGNFFLPKVKGAETSHLVKRLMINSLRRGFFLSILISTLTIFKIVELTNLLNAALVIGIILLAEIYFSGRSL